MDSWLKAILSLTIVAVSVYIILFRAHDEAARQWAVGAIALVMSHWLKDAKASSKG